MKWMIQGSGRIILVVSIFSLICLSAHSAHAGFPPPQTDSFNDAQHLRWAIYAYTVRPGIYEQHNILYGQINDAVNQREATVNLATTVFNSTLSIKSLVNPNITDFALLTTTLGAELDFIGILSGWGVEAEIADMFVAGLKTSLGDPNAFAAYCSTKSVASIIRLYDAFEHWELAEKINLASSLNELLWNFYAFGGDLAQVKGYYNIGDAYCSDTSTDIECVVKYFSETLRVDYDKLFDAFLANLRYVNRKYIQLVNLSAEVPPIPELYSPPNGVSPDQITLAWGPSGCEFCGNVAFNIEVHKDGVAVFKTDDDLGYLLTTNSITLPQPLEPNTTYWWAVFPKSQYGVWNLDVGNWSSFTTGPSGANHQPVALFTLSGAVGYPGTVFSVNADQSYDPDGTALQYRWDWGEGAGFTGWVLSPAGSHQYVQPGHYTITLCVTDGVVESHFSKSVFVWQADTPPGKVINQSPQNDTIRQPINIVLQWIEGGGATSYEVYFGTSALLTTADRRAMTSDRQFDPGSLEYDTTYYWRIDASNAYGTTPGDVWTFDTMPPPAWLDYYYWDFDTDGSEGWSGRNAVSEGIYNSDYWIVDPTADPASPSGIISAPNLTGVHTSDYEALEVRAGIKNVYPGTVQAHLLIGGSWMSPIDLAYGSGEPIADSQCVYRGNIPYTGQIQQVRIDFVEGSDSVDDRVYVDYVRFIPRAGSVSTISGYVRDAAGIGISNVSMTLTDGSGATTTDTAGSYRLEVASGWSGSLSATKTLYAMTPASVALTNVTTAVSQDFTGQLIDAENTGTTFGDVDDTLSDGYLISHGADSYAAVQGAATADEASHPLYTTMLTVGQDLAASGEFYVYRAAIPFDTSNLPDNCVIMGATLYLTGYGTDYSDTDFDIEIVTSNQVDGASLQATDYGGFGTDSGGSLNTGAWQGDNGVNAIELNPLGLTWINKDGVTLLGLRSARDIGQTEPAEHEFVNFWSLEAGGSFKPRLEIRYATDVQNLDAGPWPMFGHDPGHTSQSEYNAAGPFLNWRYATGDDIDASSPAVATDGTIYVASHDGHIYALDADGGLYWQYPAAGDNNSSPAIGAGGTVYVGTFAGNLLSLSPDGELIWSCPVGTELYSSPAIGLDGTVFIGAADGCLYAVNPNGTVKWRFLTGGGILSSPAIAADGTIYVGSLDTYLYALNADGSMKWRYQTGGAIQSSPAVDVDGTIYFGANDDDLYALYPDGNLKWCYPTGHDILSSPAIDADGIVYVGSSDDYLYALNPNGVLRWRYQTGGSIYSSPTVAADGTILFGSSDFYVYALNPDGTLAWRYATSGPVASSPAIGEDGTVYVGSWDNHLYALNIPAGQGALYGTVTDMSSGAPIYSAALSVVGSSTQSDTRGEYSFTLNPGVYNLTVSKAGYQTVTISYVLAALDQATNLDVRLTTPGLLNIVATDLDPTEVDIPYNDRVDITGGTYPYTFAVTSGSLPPGLTLDTQYGNIQGTPTTTGAYTFTITVTDALGAFADHEFTIETTEILAIVTDAALPRAAQGAVYFQSIRAVGGIQSYKFDIVGGTFPAGVGMSLSGNIGGSDFEEHFGPGAVQPAWVFGGNAQPFVTDDRLQFGTIGGLERSYAQVTMETNNQSSLRFDWEVSSCGADYLRFFVDDVEIVQWNGTQSGTYTHTGISAGTHTFRWEYNKDQFTSCGEDTGWIDNVYIDDTPAVPTETGAFAMRLKVTDAADRTAEKTFNLLVDSPLVISTGRLNDGIVGQAFNQTLTAGGGYGTKTWEVFSGALPPGLSLYGASGTITGTPSFDFYGTVVLAVHDEVGRTTYRDFIVKASRPLDIQTTALPDAYLNHAYSEMVQINGGIAPHAFSYAHQLPDGLSLDAATGIISGTPTVGQTSNVSITVADSTYPTAQSDSQTLSLHVSTDLTVTTSAVLPNAQMDAAVTPIALAAAGGPSLHSWRLIDGYLPDGVTLDPAAGTLSGTPTDRGDFIFTLQVTDGNGATADKVFFWHVSDNLTITTADLADAAINESYSHLMQAAGGIKPYTWSIVSGTLPTGLVIDSVTGAIHGTPTALQTFAFTVRVADSDAPAQTFEQEFILQVLGNLMIATPSLPNGRRYEAYTAAIDAKLGVAPYTWTLAGGDLPPGLSLTDGPQSATLSGIPTTAGTYTFTIGVTDSDTPTADGEKTFTMEIYEPVVIETEAFPCAVREQAFDQAIAVSGGHAPYTYQIIDGSLPFGLSLNHTTGAITGAAEQVGSFSSTFTLRVTDTGDPSNYDEQVLTIFVVDPLTITPATLEDIVREQPFEETLTASGGIAPYTWSLESGSLPDGITFDASTGLLSGATTTSCGSYDFTFRIEDAAPIANILSQAFTLSVRMTGDADCDGLLDDIENATCTFPDDADTDDDGITDGEEDANQNGAVDAGETDPCLTDTDGDGIQDGTELGLTLDDIGPDTDTGLFVPDADPNTTTDPLDDDSDNDGLLDGEEDINYNGRVDDGEGDPNHRTVKALPFIPLLLFNE